MRDTNVDYRKNFRNRDSSTYLKKESDMFQIYSHVHI